MSKIPFGESSIIFLCAVNDLDNSTFWTNLLVLLITYSIEMGSTVFFEKDQYKIFEDGLVALPEIINYNESSKSQHIVKPQNVVQRILHGKQDCGVLNEIIDDFRQTEQALQYLNSPIAKNTPNVVEETSPVVLPRSLCRNRVISSVSRFAPIRHCSWLMPRSSAECVCV